MKSNAPTPKGHDSHSSSTQSSSKPAGSTGRPYKSGANVHAGKGVPKPPPQTKLSGPKTDGY